MANNSKLDFSVKLVQQDAENVQLEFSPVDHGNDGQLPSTADLNFSALLPTNANLNFGSTDPGTGPSPDQIVVTGFLRFDSPTVVGTLVVARPNPVSIALRIKVPELGQIAEGQGIYYDNRVYRPLGPKVRADWQEGVNTSSDQELEYGLTLPFPSFKQIEHEIARPASRLVSTEHEIMVPRPTARYIPWLETRKLGRGTASPHALLFPAPISRLLPWKDGVPIGQHGGTAYDIGVPRSREADIPWREAQRLKRIVLVRQAVAKLLGRGFWLPWEEAVKPPPGREIVIPPVEPPVDPPYDGSPDLNFECPLLLWPASAVLLNFGQIGCPVLPVPEPDPAYTIPTRRYYYVLNDIICTRLEDGQRIELMSCDISIDWKSWAWGLTATVAARDFGKIEPTANGPVPIKIMVNGNEFRFLVESYGDKHTFGSRDVSITGRSLTAFLDAPYAPLRSFAQTDAVLSRQLADAEVVRAGLDTGYTIDWKLIDDLGWQIPPNTWSYTNLSPVQAIKEIVTGVGGYLNSHPWKSELQVRSAYPKTPWEWAAATPDVILPRSIILNQSLDWEEKPEYNGIYVSGELTGITAFGTRDGTAGDEQAPMVTDPMITDVAAARERIRAELGAGGKQAMVSVELPLTDYAPLFMPGQLVGVDESFINLPQWRALVRSVKVAGRWSDTLSVTQTIELERHY